MLVKIKDYGTGTFAFTFADMVKIMPMGYVDDVFEVYNFLGLNGFSVRTPEGLFTTDFNGTGIYCLKMVEDSSGVMLHDII